MRSSLAIRRAMASSTSSPADGSPRQLTDSSPSRSQRFPKPSSSASGSPSGSSTARARLALLKALKRLRDNPSFRVKLEGHTDNVGLPSQNLELSERRAQEVRRFLVGSGIKRNRIEVLAIGEPGQWPPIAAQRAATRTGESRVTLLTPAK